MALGSTQPITEMSTRNLPGGKGWTARKADNLTAICESIVYKMREPRRLTTLWASTACYRDNFTFFFLAGDCRRQSAGTIHADISVAPQKISRRCVCFSVGLFNDAFKSRTCLASNEWDGKDGVGSGRGLI
jgi:hypothetical protein